MNFKSNHWTISILAMSFTKYGSHTVRERILYMWLCMKRLAYNFRRDLSELGSIANKFLLVLSYSNYKLRSVSILSNIP